MKVNKVKKDIDDLAVYLIQNSLTIGYNGAIIYESGEITNISWANSNNKSFFIKHFDSFFEYLEILKNNNFNFILYDGSIIQFYFQFKNNVLIKQKLCYIPCPIIIDYEDFFEMNIIEDDLYELMKMLIETQINLTIKHLQTFGEDIFQSKFLTKSSLYFEFDKDNNNENHPASHLHINKRECRIPIFGPLSVGHFIQFIFNSFYSDTLHDHQYLLNFNVINSNKTLLANSKNSLYIDFKENIKD